MANISILLIVLLLKVVSSAEQRPNRTFHLIEKSIKHFLEARAACRENYTDLVTVCSEEENTELINLINTLPPEKSKVLIGLQRSNYSSKWSNGDEVTFSNLTGSCGPKPCCAAMKTDASWDKITCTDPRNFMCYKQDQTNYSYHLITDQSLNWYEAQSYCRKNYTDLISIRDQEQNEAVKKAGMKSTSFWIGLLRDEWEWADGKRSAYRNWNTGQPRSSTLANCTQLNNGKWQTVPCNNVVGPIMCYSQELFPTVFYPKEQSPLRTFHLIKKSINQTEARAACRENYTDLATVHSEEENTALINLINTSGWLSADSKVLIGLQRSQFSSKWSNGDEVTFSNLTGSCGTKPCCAAMKTDGSWDNIMCTETRNFICYKQVNLTSLSYHLITDQSLNWYEAQSYCRKNYTDLISIRDQDQNEAVKKAGMNSSTPFWIGLLRDEWEWADGGRSAYRNWDTGQPRSLITTSNCTQLTNKKWQAVPCNNVVKAIMCYN